MKHPRCLWTAFAALLGALLACSSATDAPDLEAVPYTLLGSGKVAFERIDSASGGVYVIDGTTRTISHLFQHELADGPALSPDGRRIAFARFTDFNTDYDVYVANGDGRGVQQVTHFQGQEGPPTWASDGRILVAADAGVGADEVYALSPTLNATDATRLTHFTGTRGCPALWGGRDFFGPIAMSVDGRLAFACQAGEIDLLFKNGTRSAAYRPGRSDNTRWTNVYSPAWSPDGAHVAFIEITTDQTADYTMVGLAVKTTDLGGTSVHTVTAVRLNKIAAGQWSGSNNFSLCWMPDGSKLVFNVPESQLVGHIWAVNPDGSGLAQLTFAPGAWDRSVSCAR